MGAGARVIIGTFLAVALLFACTSGSETRAPRGSAPKPGGTLRVMFMSAPEDTALWDPLWESAGPMFEIHRCCLLRRLFSYNGLPAGQGGATVRPDIAAGMPEVSSDGFTWTIRMKEGLHYAPPYADREIVADDVVEALERAGRLEFLLGPILLPDQGLRCVRSERCRRDPWT